MASPRAGFRSLLQILVLWPSLALAQAAPPVPPPAPTVPPQPAYLPPPGYFPPPAYNQVPYGPQPEFGPAWTVPSPQPEVGTYRHDGFYLRLGTGLAYGHVRSSGKLSYYSDPASDLSATYSGWGPAYELLIGGTLGYGFVLGGGFVGQDISDPTIDVKSDEYSGTLAARGSLGVGAFGPFVDWFPNERKGLHFGTMLGVAMLGLKNNAGGTSSGIAGSMWGGYDFWVARQWSLGIEARLAAVRASRHVSGALSGTLHDQAISAELLFSALYH